MTDEVRKPRTAQPGFGGRKKGSLNKFNGDIRRMIAGALEDVGGREYLARQAEENPVAFMGPVSKILPREVKAEGFAQIRIVSEFPDGHPYEAIPGELVISTGVPRQEPSKTIDAIPSQYAM